MITSQFNFDDKETPRLLFLGAHCDDIEIGCGGVISQLVKRYPKADIRWIVFSSNETRAQEAHNAAKLMSKGLAQLSCENFRNGFFPSEFEQIKSYFETLKTAFNPDLTFTHFKDDGHQDHRVIADLTWNTFRSHAILEYEIPKYDGDLGNPATFVPVSQKTAQEKSRIITEAFVSQQHRQWFTQDTFMALMRLRGIQCSAPGGYAEAFYTRKLCLEL